MSQLIGLDGTSHPLSHDHSIGRSRDNDLVVAGATVSSVHARLGWRGGRWVLRDLASRNGTFVNGKRCTSDGDVSLAAGAVIRFGTAENTEYTLLSDGPPLPFATRPDGAAIGCEGLLALPSAEDIQAQITRAFDGRWLAELATSTVEVTDRSTLWVGGTTWTLRLPESVQETVDASGPLLAELDFSIDVSLDQSHIHIRATHTHGTIDFGARAHNELVWLLARERLADVDGGLLSLGEQGWMYRDELAKALGVNEQSVVRYTFRARQQLSKAGVSGAQELIELRTDGRLRLGSQRVRIRHAG